MAEHLYRNEIFDIDAKNIENIPSHVFVDA